MKISLKKPEMPTNPNFNQGILAYMTGINAACIADNYTPIEPFTIEPICEGPYEKIVDATGRSLYYII